MSNSISELIIKIAHSCIKSKLKTDPIQGKKSTRHYFVRRTSYSKATTQGVKLVPINVQITRIHLNSFDVNVFQPE